MEEGRAVAFIAAVDRRVNAVGESNAIGGLNARSRSQNWNSTPVNDESLVLPHIPSNSQGATCI